MLGFSDHGLANTKALRTQKDPPANETVEQFWDLRSQDRQRFGQGHLLVYMRAHTCSDNSRRGVGLATIPLGELDVFLCFCDLIGHVELYPCIIS